MMGDDPLDLSGVPMMGLHGVSKSAKDRKKNGLVYFNHFLEEVAQSKEATPKKWEDMAEAEICRVELFQAFGEFMKNRPNTGRGEPLSISTAQDYFSGAITYFKNDRYKDNAIWNGTGGVTDQAPVWYSTLRQQLATQAIRDAQKRGEKIEKKSDEIGRAGLSQAIKRTLLDGIVVVVFLFTVGRPSSGWWRRGSPRCRWCTPFAVCHGSCCAVRDRGGNGAEGSHRGPGREEEGASARYGGDGHNGAEADARRALQNVERGLLLRRARRPGVHRQ